MSEISQNEYVVSKYSITDYECDGGCTDCDRAENMKQDEKAEEDSVYIIDLPKTLYGVNYLSNHNYTVGKAELSDLEGMKKVLKMPQELIEKKYVSNEFMENHYPEWIRTTEILGITEQPEKVIYARNYPMILIMSDCLYMVAPRLFD